MGERRVLIVIDPPEQGRCHDGKGPGSAHICRWYTTTYGNCRLGYGTDGVNQTRPAACIAAETEAARANEWWALAFEGVADPQRDRVADALAAVFCGEPVEL